MNLVVTDILVLSFFATWLLASLFSQLSKPSVLNYDYLYILPVCRFFSPKPISKDIVLYVQGSNDSEYQTVWKQVIVPVRRWWNFIWNPHHRISKTIISIYQQMKSYDDDNRHIVHLSTPYLTILNMISSLYLKDKKVKNIQFMLAKYAGCEEDVREIIFLSNIHSV